MKFLRKMCVAASLILLTSLANASNFQSFEVDDELTNYDLGTYEYSLSGYVRGVVAGAINDTGFFEILPGDFNSGVYELSFQPPEVFGELNAKISQGSVVYDLTKGVAKRLDFSAGGTWNLEVTGNALGDGTYTFVMSPIPEASTVAMMLSGLGCIAFAARRKRKQ